MVVDQEMEFKDNQYLLKNVAFTKRSNLRDAHFARSLFSGGGGGCERLAAAPLNPERPLGPLVTIHCKNRPLTGSWIDASFDICIWFIRVYSNNHASFHHIAAVICG
jgi:hypothetical protein